MRVPELATFGWLLKQHPAARTTLRIGAADDDSDIDDDRS